jgi:flagellar hook-length control protein FliK
VPPAESANGESRPLDAPSGHAVPVGAPAGSTSGGQDAGQSAKGGAGSGAASMTPAATATSETGVSPNTAASAANPVTRPEQQAAPAALAPAVAPTTPTATPVQAVMPASGTTATAHTAAPASTPTNTAADLPAQLSRPLFTLASAGRGQHVMTVHVTPEALGPVTVRAHVGAEGVRVELFAPTDVGRDALRSILPDLRRDLSGAGLSGSLDLSSQNQPSPNGDERAQWLSNARQNESGDPSGNAPRASVDPDQTQPRAPRPGEPVHTIDLVV